MFAAKWQSTDVSASTAPSAKEEALALAAAADAIDGPVRVKAYKKRKKSNVWTTRSPNFRSQQACFSPILCLAIDSFKFYSTATLLKIFKRRLMPISRRKIQPRKIGRKNIPLALLEVTVSQPTFLDIQL
jgi:hypothetical protein